MVSEINYDQIIADFQERGASSLDKKMIKKALEYAVKYHGEQTRASGEKYFHHPITVAKIVAEWKFGTDAIITAILHDTIEDTELTFEDIEREFSPNIAKLVDGVTKLTKIRFKPYDIMQAENFRKLLIAMSHDIRVLVVKLADRLHNMRTIDYIKRKEKRERIALETMEIYAPLAERIGMQKIKVELQDICFRILHPDIRNSIIERLENVTGNTTDIINKIIDELRSVINSTVPDAVISGRKKTPYSVWMKMKQKNVNIDQLSDVIAFRVVNNTLEECYQVLGAIHSKYKMVPNCFQDFISTPKNNGYQSIHTVVIGPFGCKIEIQVRTKEMHEIAELGVAAHWQYKQGHDDHLDGKRYAWIRELLSIFNHDTTPEESFKNTKLAMYYDQVFCFTTKGKVISLPKGATAIDFAYAVHSDIGNHCSSAKVNGMVVPVHTELANGDQVEIITSKVPSVSSNWERFVVTGKARSEIRKTTKDQKYEQYIKLGSNILLSIFKTYEINSQGLKDLCSFYNKNKQELEHEVGRGEILPEEIIQFFKPKKSRFNLSNIVNLKSRNNDVSKLEAVSIKGLLPGVVMHIAKCCNPLPGDKIIGVMHTGMGITVHASDCSMLDNFAKMPNRLIMLTWDKNNHNVPFIGCIEVVMLNEPSSLSTVTNDMAKLQANITNFNIADRTEHYFTIKFYIHVTSEEHLDQIINMIKMKKVVKSIRKLKY